MIKMVCCDMAGTLVRSDGVISEETIELIKKLNRQGTKFVISSGGSRGKIMPLADKLELSSHIISSNGASIYSINEGIEVFRNPMDEKSIKELEKIAKDSNLEFSCYTESVVYKNKNIDFDYEKLFAKNTIIKQPIVQCNLKSKEKIDINIDEIEEKIKKIKNIKIASKNLKQFNGFLYFDVVKKNSDKKNAVKYLMDLYKYNRDEVVVIGDNNNDIESFRLVDNSFAMGNASDDVKKEARYVTDTNDNEGVKKVLIKVLGGNI